MLTKVHDVIRPYYATLSYLTVAYLIHMATQIWVNIGSSNGVLLNGTKPLTEQMLTYHQWGPVTSICGQFHKS